MIIRKLTNQELADLVEASDWPVDRADLLSEVCRALRQTPAQITVEERLAVALIERSVPIAIGNVSAAEFIATVATIIAKGIEK